MNEMQKKDVVFFEFFANYGSQATGKKQGQRAGANPRRG